MAREFARTDRIADAIKRSLAGFIQHEIRDPRVGMVNINSVDVTRDLAFAKVYVSFVGRDEADEQECDESVKVLNGAAGFLRSLLAKEMNIRTTPKLTFFYDKTALTGQRLSGLIDRAISQDNSQSDS